MAMNSADLTPPTPMSMHQVSRPTLGFPLGTALLLIIIFCLSGIFSCCYHWDKLRSLHRRHNTATHLLTTATAITTTSHHQDSNLPSPSKLTAKHQVFYALAFTAAPLTLCVPPVRSLNLFVETVDVFVRETAEYSLRTVRRIRVGYRRIRAAVLRFIHHA